MAAPIYGSQLNRDPETGRGPCAGDPDRNEFTCETREELHAREAAERDYDFVSAKNVYSGGGPTVTGSYGIRIPKGMDTSNMQDLKKYGVGGNTYSNQYGSLVGGGAPTKANPFGTNSKWRGTDTEGNQNDWDHKYWGYMQDRGGTGDPYLPGGGAAMRALGYDWKPGNQPGFQNNDPYPWAGMEAGSFVGNSQFSTVQRGPGNLTPAGGFQGGGGNRGGSGGNTGGGGNRGGYGGNTGGGGNRGGYGGVNSGGTATPPTRTWINKPIGGLNPPDTNPVEPPGGTPQGGGNQSSAMKALAQAVAKNWGK